MPELHTHSKFNPPLVVPIQSGIVYLNQASVIRVTGDDAVNFLHSQLTNDINNLEANHICHAGFCTPKGRMLASMLVWNDHGVISLEVSNDIHEHLLKRLQMYVLRAKVKLESQSQTHRVLGILGSSTLLRLSAWLPVVPAAAYQLVSNQYGALLRLANVGETERYQWIIPNDLAEKLQPELQELTTTLSENAWNLTEIHAAIARITLVTQEKFVPQMINFELIGGVNFKKGCYPGQEIVARTHYLGKQKRRTLLARIESSLAEAGSEVFADSDPDQPCGMVVNSALNDQGGSDCLIEIKTEYVKNTSVRLKSGELCHWLPMPYLIPIETT